MKSTPKLSIVFDNYPCRDDMTSLWGFAALIECEGRRILFDTGSNGRVLLQNMTTMGITAKDFDLIFLSHFHWDHIGGYDSVLELDPHAMVVVNDAFAHSFNDDLRLLCENVVVVGDEALEVLTGVYSTGRIAGDPPEHALVLDIGGVGAVMCGCAHPGVDVVVERAAAVLGKPIHWVIGGFHLMMSDAAAITGTIAKLKSLGVRAVAPTHCTGDAAITAFAEAYRDSSFAGGTGREITLAALPR